MVSKASIITFVPWELVGSALSQICWIRAWGWILEIYTWQAVQVTCCMLFENHNSMESLILVPNASWFCLYLVHHFHISQSVSFSFWKPASFSVILNSSFRYQAPNLLPWSQLSTFPLSNKGVYCAHFSFPTRYSLWLTAVCSVFSRVRAGECVL